MAYKKTKIYTCESPIAGKQVYFKSNQDMTGLLVPAGLTEFTPQYGTDIINGFYEANSPKIPRVSVVVGAKKKTTFCNAATVPPQGTNSGETQYAKKIFKSIASPTALVVSVYVVIFGIKFAWNMPRFQYDKISADLGGLGIDIATSTDEPDLVWGATAPRPARVRKFDPNGEDGGNTYTTYCSLAKENSLPPGWIKVGSSINVSKALLK
jgi:hypothetical protein